MAVFWSGIDLCATYSLTKLNPGSKSDSVSDRIIDIDFQIRLNKANGKKRRK